MSGGHNFLHRPTTFFSPLIVNHVNNYENCVRSQELVTQLVSLNVSNEDIRTQIFAPSVIELSRKKLCL